jgi:hypothetical protein
MDNAHPMSTILYKCTRRFFFPVFWAIIAIVFFTLSHQSWHQSHAQHQLLSDAARATIKVDGVRVFEDTAIADLDTFTKDLYSENAWSYFIAGLTALVSCFASLIEMLDLTKRARVGHSTP